LSTPYDNSAAVVVLPAVGGGRLADTSLRRWLARGELNRLDAPRELLARVLGALNVPYPDSGLAALRMWGQTGERPTVWLSAADPVYLEPRLDHLAVHAQDAESVPPADLRPLFDHLQRTLGGDGGIGFARLGGYGYLRAAEPIATAAVPPYVAHLDMPNAYLPMESGADAYRRLTSEVEMALHEHEVNQDRAARGLQPINGLWLWGGGYAPEQTSSPLPPLYTDDPLLAGYWLSNSAPVSGWPGDIATCAASAAGGFVATVPEKDGAAVLEACLGELAGLLEAGRLRRLVLLFRDGVEVSVERRHRWRFWRRDSEYLA
jgi:hypothetical protein